MSARKKTLLPGLILIFTFSFLVLGIYWPSLSQAATTTTPEVTTKSASSIGDDYATLNAEIESDGGRDITEYGFYYGTTSSCSTKKKVGTDIDEGDSFSVKISSLKSGKKYYYKAYAKNAKGTSYGSVKNFTPEDEDEDEDKPTVTTVTSSSIGSTYATLKGKIDSDSNSDITEYGFYYGTTSSCSTKKKVGTDIDEGDSFSVKISSLKSGTKYYYKAYAENANGTSYGSVKNFTPEDEDEDEDKPTVTTVTSSSIGSTYATLKGKIDSDSNSDITEYGFYYGTTSSCSTKKKVGTDIDEGDSFSVKISSLKSGTKYYYKAYAENANGTSYGSVKNFTPGDDDEDKPAVTTKTPSTGDGYATLYGVATSKGDSDIKSYGFYYGSSSSPSTKIEVDDDDINEDEIFSYKLTGLSSGITYYVKAYATNDEGTSYGSVLSFKVNNTTSTTVVTSENPSIFSIGSKNYKIRGAYQTGDVAPYIKNGRTYLPIRTVAYTLGITDSDISWDAATQTVTLTKGSKVVKLKIKDKIMYANGAYVTMDTAPEISNGRTCLPISHVVQAFGATATWEASTQSVTIR